MRILYRALLWLHPPAFRRAFASEMLWIYDQTAERAAVWLLLLDAALSLTRQWLLRSGAWKWLAAGAGGLAQITLGGFGWVLFGYLHGQSHRPEPPFADAELGRLIYLVVWTTGGVIFSVIALALWVKTFAWRRIHHDA
jgi:hypothetical protein